MGTVTHSLIHPKLPEAHSHSFTVAGNVESHRGPSTSQRGLDFLPQKTLESYFLINKGLWETKHLGHA